MDLHYFLAVCNDLNFTRAAKRRNVSQPSLTRAIQLLEKEFGGYLFRPKEVQHRANRLGKLVRPYLEGILAHDICGKANRQGIFRERTRSNLMS